MANLAASTKIHTYEVNVGLVEVQPHSNAHFLPKVAVFCTARGKIFTGEGIPCTNLHRYASTTENPNRRRRWNPQRDQGR
jgi:hypothetical protein